MDYTLNIYVDLECKVYCDFKYIGTASPTIAFSIELMKRTSYLLDFVINGKNMFRHELDLSLAIADEGTIKVQLARVLFKTRVGYLPYSKGSPKYLFIDTETTGLPQKDEENDHSYLDFDYWPHIVQLAYVLYDSDWRKITTNSYIIAPDNYVIPQTSTRVHGISHEEAKKHGIRRENLFSYLNDVLLDVDYIIGHNVTFDVSVLKCEIMRVKRDGKLEQDISFKKKKHTLVDTMKIGAYVCRIPTLRFDGYKYPSLIDLYKSLFSKEYNDQHNALADVKATASCFFRMWRFSHFEIDNIKELEWKLFETEWFDAEGCSDFNVKYKNYESEITGDMIPELVLSLTYNGKEKNLRISKDSDLTEGDIIDVDTIERLIFKNSSGERLWRYDAEIIDEEKSGWDLVSSTRIAGIKDVVKIYVVNKRYTRLNGHEILRKSMCFRMEDGTNRYIPLCKKTNLDIADTIEIDSVRLCKYEKNGKKRYGVVGDLMEAELGEEDKRYIDISDFEYINNIHHVFIEDENRVYYIGRHKAYYSQLVMRIQINGSDEIKFDLRSDSLLYEGALVDPKSIMIFTYKRHGEEYQEADGIRWNGEEYNN